MKEKNYPVIHIGATSLLTVFVILCMVSFATLSYLTAERENSLNSRVRERNDAYCLASNLAWEKIAAIDETLFVYWENGEWEKAEKTYAFTVPIDESSLLSVVLTTQTPQKEGDTLYRISEFRELSSREWKGDHSIQLLPSEVP